MQDKSKNLLWTAVQGVKKVEVMGGVASATTSHPPSDLWVAVMTDGEPL